MGVSLDRLAWWTAISPGDRGYVVGLSWKADRRRRLTLYDIPAASTLDAVAEALAGCLWVPRPGHRARPAVAARVRRFLAADPLTGVTVTYDAPLLTITLAPGVRWTPARVRAASLECQILGAGLTLAATRATYDNPSDVALVVRGSSLRWTWGDRTSQTILVPEAA